MVTEAMTGDQSTDEGKEKAMVIEQVKDIRPPDMIRHADDLDVYKKRLRRWSRLSTLSPQTQFDLILHSMDQSHPLCTKLEEEIGDSTKAKIEGIEVVISKLEEIFGKEEEIDAFRNY